MIHVAEITYTGTMMFGPVGDEWDGWWYRTRHHVGIGTPLLGGAPTFEALARPFSLAGAAPTPAVEVEPHTALVAALGGIRGRPDKHVTTAHHQVGGQEQTYIREWPAANADVEYACRGLGGAPVQYTMTVHQDGTYICEWMNGAQGRGEGESSSIITGRRNCTSWLRAVAASL